LNIDVAPCLACRQRGAAHAAIPRVPKARSREGEPGSCVGCNHRFWWHLAGSPARIASTRTPSRALLGLIERAIAMCVTPSTESEGACSTPVHATAGSLIAIGLSQIARQLPSLETVAEGGGPQELSLGGGPSEVLGAAEIVEDKPPGARPFDEVDPAPPSTTSPFADTAAEPTQPFEVDSVEFWGPRLDSYQRWRIWAPEWGPRPDQDRCLAPDCLL